MVEHRVEFTESENPWAPTAVVEEINERTGAGLRLVGLAEQTGGTSSAAFVRWPDGRDSALTRTATSLARMRQTAEVVALAHDDGLPVPRHELVLELTDGRVAVVAERLPGRHAPRVDAHVVDAMVATNERFAGLFADRPDVPPPPAFAAPASGEHPWQQTLGRHSDRTRRVLDRVGEPFQMAGDDLVHSDYSLGNVLWNDAWQITGVVDWNFGAFRGDRWFALIGMRYHLHNEGGWYDGQRLALDRLDAVLRSAVDPATLRAYWTHRAVHGLHASIANGSRADRIEHDLRFAESKVG